MQVPKFSSSIQVTVDIYGHLIRCERLVCGPARCGGDEDQAAAQESANNTQTLHGEIEQIPAELMDLIGGGGRTRTYDLRIMRCSFRRAATRIQSLIVGTGHLIRDCVHASYLDVMYRQTSA
jgi:hypothetical protein